MMMLTVKPKVMGQFTLSSRLKMMGWLATFVMGIAAIGMLAMTIA